MTQVKHADNIIYLSGDIDFKNANEIDALVKDYLLLSSVGSIDFSAVTQVNSVIFAMMFDWLRANRSLRFLNSPEKMRKIAKLYGVENYLA